MLTVPLVTTDSSLAGEIDAALSGSDVSLGAVIPPDAIDGLEGVTEALLIAGALRARDELGLERARARFPETCILVCAPESDARSVRWAVNSGADGVVWLDRIASALLPTLQAVRQGQLVVPREARRQIAPPELTTREKQVLSLVVMGLSNGEIGSKLYLTESTVKSHLSTAFRKLGVTSRAEAARMISDPERGFGTGILAITGPTLSGYKRGDA